MRNVPYRLKVLNTLSLVSWTVWVHCETSRGGALLAGEHHWRQTLGDHSPTLFPFSFLCCLFVVKNVNSQLPHLTMCLHVFPVVRDSPSRTISPNKPISFLVYTGHGALWQQSTMNIIISYVLYYLFILFVSALWGIECSRIHEVMSDIKFEMLGCYLLNNYFALSALFLIENKFSIQYILISFPFLFFSQVLPISLPF